MENYEKIVFSPAEGYQNASAYETRPLSESRVREIFNALPFELRDYINSHLVPKLNEDRQLLRSAGGAAEIGAQSPAAGYGDTVQDILQNLYRGLSDAILGQIPDSSIAQEKLDSALLEKILKTAGMPDDVVQYLLFPDSMAEEEKTAFEADAEKMASVSGSPAYVPIGDIRMTGYDLDDPDWLKCDGALQSGEDYPKLLSKIGGNYTAYHTEYQIFSAGLGGYQTKNMFFIDGYYYLLYYTGGPSTFRTKISKISPDFKEVLDTQDLNAYTGGTSLTSCTDGHTIYVYTRSSNTDLEVRAYYDLSDFSKYTQVYSYYYSGGVSGVVMDMRAITVGEKSILYFPHDGTPRKTRTYFLENNWLTSRENLIKPDGTTVYNRLYYIEGRWLAFTMTNIYEGSTPFQYLNIYSSPDLTSWEQVGSAYRIDVTSYENVKNPISDVYYINGVYYICILAPTDGSSYLLRTADLLTISPVTGIDVPIYHVGTLNDGRIYAAAHHTSSNMKLFASQDGTAFSTIFDFKNTVTEYASIANGILDRDSFVLTSKAGDLYRFIIEGSAYFALPKFHETIDRTYIKAK